MCFCCFPLGRGHPTCINELMQSLMLAFNSPSAPWPWRPPLRPPSFAHTDEIPAHTADITREGVHSFTSPAGEHAAFVSAPRR